MPNLSRSTAAALLLLAPATNAQVLVPEGTDFQANTYTTEIQIDPSIAVDVDGSFVVVWTDAVLGAYQAYYVGVRGQRFDADARPLGGDFSISVDPTFSRLTTDVALGDGGDFLVVWSGEEGIRGQRFASSGEELGGAFQVSSESPVFQARPSVAAHGDGHFVVVWQAVATDTDLDGTSVQGRRFASDGTPLSEDFQVNSYTTGDQLRPVVSAAPDGRFVVAWESDGSSGSDDSDFSVQGRRFAADGSPQGDSFQVNTYTTGIQGDPALAVAPDGHFVVAWASHPDPSGLGPGDAERTDVRARLFDSDAGAQSDDFLVNSATPFDQIRPSVAIDARGDFTVVWQLQKSPNFDGVAEIWGRQFSSTGDPKGLDLLLNTTRAGRHLSPDLAMDDEGNAVVTWGFFERINRLNQVYEILGRRLTVRSSAGTDFAWYPESLLPGQAAQFFDVSAGRPTSWSWNFGDGTVSDLRHPRHSFDRAGRHEVTLTLSDGSSASRIVRVFGCETGTQVLCLADRRFRVELEWRDFTGNTGPGRVAPAGSDNSGLLWFFSADNWEMLVKVLDGCSINGHFWVFAAATTNVEYTLRVTDENTDEVREYFNPLGQAAPALTDTAAFATCP